MIKELANKPSYLTNDISFLKLEIKDKGKNTLKQELVTS